ncbi:MAG: glutamine amidotransferase [Methylovirgula sp.]
MTKRAVAIRHIHFEDLGVFAPVLADHRYKAGYCDAASRDLRSLDPLEPDLLIVLGAPVGVYEKEAYPFLGREQDILAARLERNRPTLGVCLGAQLMAATMGAKVFPSGVKEIGFAPLSLTQAGREGPLRHLAGIAVLHWHGDTFDLPEGTINLAATQPCAHQAFAHGSNILGLQFHMEADTTDFEHWLIGHAAELAGAGIDPRQLRAEAMKIGPALAKAATATFSEWLRDLIF